jgi:hypothetical protein
MKKLTINNKVNAHYATQLFIVGSKYMRYKFKMRKDFFFLVSEISIHGGFAPLYLSLRLTKTSCQNHMVKESHSTPGSQETKRS